MTNTLIDPDVCRQAFGVMITGCRALVLVKSQIELREAFEDLLMTAEDLRVPIRANRTGGTVTLTIASGVPKDHQGSIEIVVRRLSDGLRGKIAHLILHPFNVAPSEVYPVIASTGGEVIRYEPRQWPDLAGSL